jgi:hypothetical protein
LEFFETSGRNLLAAEAAAGVGHHVALSVVVTDRLPASGLLAREDGPGKPDQGLQDSLYDPSLNAVLRVRERHRPIGDRGADGSEIRSKPRLFFTRAHFVILHRQRTVIMYA